MTATQALSLSPGETIVVTGTLDFLLRVGTCHDATVTRHSDNDEIPCIYVLPDDGFMNCVFLYREIHHNRSSAQEALIQEARATIPQEDQEKFENTKRAIIDALYSSSRERLSAYGRDIS